MEKMEKGFTVQKWVLINRPKIPQIPPKLFAQIVCPSPKVWDFDEKRLHWAFVVRGIQGPFEMKMASSYSCRKRLCASRVAETILNLGRH